jgi:hypothetical protein
MLVKLADLLIEIVQCRHLLPSGASVPGIHVRDVKCGPDGFARRNASPMVLIEER